MLEEQLNKEILNWWYQLPHVFRSNKPTFIHPLNNEAKILFVGLNPSGNTNPETVIENISNEDIQQKICTEIKAIFGDGTVQRIGQYKRYYKPITDIADDLELEFEHCDLFQMSYQNAKVVVNELFDSRKELKPQHKSHLLVFDEIYKFVSPNIVITNNVNTANILKKHLELKFDTETGLYKDKNGICFYLNGIMSYGRQTKYDRERLMWQIKKVLYLHNLNKF